MKGYTILIAEDDLDDRLIMEEAFGELGCCGTLHFVQNGEELMRYLRRSEKYADVAHLPLPSLILLDLNMPGKSGRQALVEIKLDPDFQEIPVVIWTTSHEEYDKIQCRKAGADAYVTKPMSYSELVNRLKKVIAKYISREPRPV